MDEGQKGILIIAKGFSDDTTKEFSLEKRAKATFTEDRLTNVENIEINNDTIMQDQEQDKNPKEIRFQQLCSNTHMTGQIY